MDPGGICFSIDFIKYCNIMGYHEVTVLKVPPEVIKHKRYQDWKNYHLENRHVLKKILTEIDRGRAAGLKKLSIKAIINAIRWDISIETKTENFKINDAFTGIYTHIIIFNFPTYKNLLTARELRAKI